VYDSELVREEVDARGYEAHIRERGSEERGDNQRRPGARARHWVMERTHSWLNRHARLLVCWEKKTENYLTFVHLVCAQLVFSKIPVSR
jgi:putative transposase